MEVNYPKRIPLQGMLHSHHLLILARCVFVTQTAVCTTKTLAPKGEMNYSKVVIKKTEWI